MRAIAAVMNWPPLFYSALAIVLLCKWALWFPVMVVRLGLHGALDAALACPDGPAGRSPTVRHTSQISDAASITAPAMWTPSGEAGGGRAPEPKGAAGVGV
jgi:hypothetical protein